MSNPVDIAERYRRCGTEEWGVRGSATEHHRYAEQIDPRSPHRCGCGCKRRASHRGMANGICLATGCELWIRRWVRDPASAIRARAGQSS